MVNDVASETCKYQSSNALGQRKCGGNLLDGPKWEKSELSNCSAKEKTTNYLLDLSKVFCKKKSLLFQNVEWDRK